MPRVCLALSSISTSSTAGNVRKCAAYNVTVDSPGNGRYDDFGTQRVSNTFTIPNGVTVSAMGIWFHTYTTRAGYISLKLQKGGVDITGATCSMQVTAGNFPARYGFRTLPNFTTPVVGDGSSTYRIVAQCTTATAFGGSAQANSIGWMRSATASDWGWATIDDSDTTTGITAGDTLVTNIGANVTVDSTTPTLAPIVAGGPSLWLGDGSNLIGSAGGTIDLGAGNLDWSSNSALKAGTSGSPLSGASPFTIKTSLPTGSFLIQSHYMLTDLPDYSKYVEWFGANSVTSCYLHIGSAYSGSNASGQNKITFEEAIPGTWTVGDSIPLMAKDQAGGDAGNAGAYYTISAIDAPNKTITINANLNASVITGGVVINVSECARVCGIQIQSTNRIKLAYVQSPGNDQNDHATIKGVYAKNCSLAMNDLTGSTSVIDGWFTDFQGNNVYPMEMSIGWTGGSTVSRVFHFGRGAGTGLDPQMTIYGGSGTYNTIWMQATGNANSGTSTGIQTTSNTYNEIGLVNQPNIVGYVAWNLAGINNIVNTLRCIGAAWRMTGQANVVDGGFQRSAGFSAGFLIQSCTNAEARNFTFGVGTSNSNYDINPNATGFGNNPSFIQMLFTNCSVGGRGINTVAGSGTPLMFDGSYLQFHNYGGVVGDHRTWKPYGTFATDVTYTKLSQTVTDAALGLKHTFKLLSGVIAGEPMYLSVSAQISSAAYYGGVYSAPKVDVFVDSHSTTGSPDATATLALLTAAQVVNTPVTPGASNGIISLVPTSKSDAGASSTVVWNSLQIIKANWLKVKTITPIPISETLTYPVAAIPSDSTNSAITQTNQATVDAYPGIAVNANIVLTSDHSLLEVYDFGQSWQTKSENIVSLSPLVTTDKLNYSMGGNLTLTGANLSGTGRIILASGKAFTRTNGTEVSSVVIQSDAGTTGYWTQECDVGATVDIRDHTGARVRLVASSSGAESVFIPHGVTGSYTMKFAKYGYDSQTVSVVVTGGGYFAGKTTLVPVTQYEPNPAVVAAYTVIDTPNKLHDYAHYFETTSTGIVYPLAAEQSGDTVNSTSFIVINKTAAAAFAFDGTNITIKANDYGDGPTAKVTKTTQTITLQNGATISSRYEDSTGKAAKLTLHLPRSAMTVCVQNAAGVDQVCTPGLSGDYSLLVLPGATGTWKWGVKQQGYEAATGTFQPSLGLLTEVSPVCAPIETTAGASMYQGTTSSLVQVVFSGGYAYIDIGNGTPPLQAIYDMVENALVTANGIDWLLGGNGTISIFKSIGGNFLFLSDKWRARRWHAGDINSTVPAYIQSTDNTPTDGTNGPVYFLTSDTPTSVAAAVRTALAVELARIDINTSSVPALTGSGTVVTGWSRDRILRKLAALAISKTSGNSLTGGVVTIRTLDDTADEMSATLDTNGNRTAVTQGP